MAGEGKDARSVIKRCLVVAGSLNLKINLHSYRQHIAHLRGIPLFIPLSAVVIANGEAADVAAEDFFLRLNFLR